MDKERLIANYFLANLSEDEKRIFNTLFETDSDFKKEVEFQKRIKHAVVKNENDKLKQQLQAFEKEFKITKTRKLWWITAAASVLILVTFGIYFFNPNYSNDELFAMYFEPAKNIVHPIVRNGDTNNELTNAFIAYQKQDYRLAQQLFEELFQTTQISELLFYEAISFLETNQPDLAIKNLREHQKFADALSDRTKWYLALAYLKQDNREVAKLILKEIVSNTIAFNYKEAKILLKKL